MNMVIRVLVSSMLCLLAACSTSPLSTTTLSLDGSAILDARLLALDAGLQPSDSGAVQIPETWWELGDSITYGTGTTPVVGYRRTLWQWAESRKCKVTFEGTTVTGDWANPVHDGHPGFTIENLQVEVKGVYGTHVAPADLVLFMAGTNNMGTLKGVAYDRASAVAHYAALLDAIAAVNPDGSILVTTIPPIDPETHPGPAANVVEFNASLPAVWDAFDRSHEHSVLRADVGKRLSPWSVERFLPEGNVHPIAAGYAIIADEFERTIRKSGRCL